MNANQRVLLDARTGEPVRRYPLVHSALNRRVHDSANSTADPGMLIRSEGQGASGIAQVDLAYEFLGDVYNFYRTQHGRDSIDGRGLRLNATVRFCQASTNCPMRGAFWSIDNRRMYFGDEFAVDDVIGHELTHGVTDFESNLVYENASGAINESFSDVWGEFVDLTNGRGNDADAVRWDVGEDLPRGRIRSISNPPATFQPARVGGEFYIQPVAEPTNENDYGGVHTNSGINNKLCYLLVDGDSFNGESIEGMGIGRVADLYYEVQTHLLTSGADWTDLFHALQQGAINLDWTVAEQNNLLRACRSVNVAGPGNNVYVDRGNTCPLPRGSESCTSLGVGGPFVQVADGAAAARPGDNLLIRAGNYPAPITLDKVMQVQAYDGTVFIGQ
jgi:Zn-dependent metalloprotease